ncbi:3-hydroxyacyl-CoA dehydrogenase [Candidatus Sulfidibacterium hydrothermale]|uniref:3-hydroxyacyl-CoA dehydrogenase n=1 Tax=Candidatus Sulfidibacterium hydrothermale TaxID=2875962 RepID=UPI001F0B12FA|nr:3-hydroxyacyl-CoA dehydrogenase [Candidatus Sulfidibacterium hydrothermale]UBM62683.1 3-hydroxyacyl-CoA dehydrogenase [Candidatus Sulfidibacterium hydrothermale]
MKNIAVLGAGVLGSQVAWQAAFHGMNVSVYDISPEALQKAREKHREFAVLFQEKYHVTEEETKNALKRLRYFENLAEAVQDADITSESVPEVLEIKKDFYRKLAAVAPEKTIFTTNSSTMIPSMFSQETGRPEKFLAMHFANPVWEANIAEVMGHAGTQKAVFDAVVDFTREMGMVPVPLYKEQPGYVINSLLSPFLSAAANLYFNGVADYKTIDKTWMISTGARSGPFGIMDLVGMQTMYNVMMLKAKQTGNPDALKRAEAIKTQFIDKGKMGIASGEGFYRYPNPAYKDPDFLK